MNYRGILKTAITKLNKEQNVYETHSPLSDRVYGCAITAKRSHANFVQALNDTYVAYHQKTLVRPPGRPKKDGVSLHALVKPSIKEAMTNQAEVFNISMGELIEYLFLKQDNQ